MGKSMESRWWLCSMIWGQSPLAPTRGVSLLQPSLEVGYPNDLTDVFFCFSSFLPTPFKHIISLTFFVSGQQPLWCVAPTEAIHPVIYQLVLLQAWCCPTFGDSVGLMICGSSQLGLISLKAPTSISGSSGLLGTLWLWLTVRHGKSPCYE